MGAFDFSIDVDLVERLRQVLPLSVFVETGTFEGEAVARVLPFFEELHSIELAESYHAGAAERFRGHTNVTVHLGDSRHVVEDLRPALQGKSVLYWLDAHWCVADGTAGAPSECPLLEELAAIGELNAESTVLIDDARLFLATPPAPYEADEWPRFHEVIQELLSLSMSHEITVINDVIVFYPKACRQAVSDYARARGVDLLAQTHRLSELDAEYAAQARAAADRLAMIEALERERDLQTKAAEERLAMIEDLTRDRDLHATAVAEHLATIEGLTRERNTSLEEVTREHDIQAKAAEERLATIEELIRERDLHARAAEERLARIQELAAEHAATIEQLTRERDLQAKAAEERLEAIEGLKRERDVHARAAQERLASMEAIGHERSLRSDQPPRGWQ